MSINRSLGKLAARVAITLFATAVLLVLSFTVASAATINVPADHATIHAAVAAAVSGDTITVDAGSFDLPSQLVIDKDLSIVGSGMNNTIITTSFNTGSSGDGRGLILVPAGITFNISNLTIDGSGQLVWQGIRHLGAGGMVDSVRFTEIKFNESGPHYAGTGIAVFGSGPVDVVNSEFSEMGRIGAQFFGPGVDGSLYDNNTFTGKGDGDFLDYGVEVGGGAPNIEISNSTITDSRGVASSDGSTSAGILVTTFFGAGSSAVIHDNNFSDNTTAIAVGFDASDTSDVEAFNNNITGNGTGVSSTDGPEVNAMCNWWGDVSGPSGGGPGTGDSVIGNVLFSPWLTSSAPGGDCNGPLPPPPPSNINSSLIDIRISNAGRISNTTTSDANTGGNSAGGSTGGSGGTGGNVTSGAGDENNGGATAGNGGNGGNGGAGGFVQTGDASAEAGSENALNSTDVDVELGCGCGDINGLTALIDIDNDDPNNRILNLTRARGRTGDNNADGSTGGSAGNGGQISAGTGDNNNGGATGGSGGAGGAGDLGGEILTGAAISKSGSVNLLNTSFIRLR